MLRGRQGWGRLVIIRRMQQRVTRPCPMEVREGEGEGEGEGEEQGEGEVHNRDKVYPF